MRGHFPDDGYPSKNTSGSFRCKSIHVGSIGAGHKPGSVPMNENSTRHRGKSFVDDLARTGYCKRQSGLAATIRWDSALVRKICYSPIQWIELNTRTHWVTPLPITHKINKLPDSLTPSWEYLYKENKKWWDCLYSSFLDEKSKKNEWIDGLGISVQAHRYNYRWARYFFIKGYWKGGKPPTGRIFSKILRLRNRLSITYRKKHRLGINIRFR